MAWQIFCIAALITLVSFAVLEYLKKKVQATTKDTNKKDFEPFLYIIAANGKRAELLAKTLHLNENQYKYVARPEQLNGLKNFLYKVYYPGLFEHGNRTVYAELEKYIQAGRAIEYDENIHKKYLERDKKHEKQI